MNQKPQSPKFEVVQMKNWALKDLKSTFVIPSFERKVDRRHVGSITQAILNNEFFDIVFRGTKLPDGKIDLQEWIDVNRNLIKKLEAEIKELQEILGDENEL